MRVELDDKKEIKLDKKTAIEYAENMAEELFKKNADLDDAYPFIPDQIRKEMIKINPDKMEKAKVRYEKRLKKEDKLHAKFQKLMIKRNKAVHMPLEEYEKAVKDGAVTHEQKHLRFVKEALMQCVYSMISAWVVSLNEGADLYRVQERSFGDREKKIKAGKKLTDHERYGILKFEVQKDGTKMPVMEDKVMLPIDNIKSTDFYTYYMGEILERLIRENVEEYKDKLNITGITQEYEEEARKLKEEFDKLQ